MWVIDASTAVHFYAILDKPLWGVLPLPQPFGPVRVRGATGTGSYILFCWLHILQ